LQQLQPLAPVGAFAGLAPVGAAAQ
jgi:hypothetical protein